MKHLFLVILLSGCPFISHAQDILVTNEGESFKVYNLEIGSSNVFYQLSDDDNSEVKRINKKDVLIIKKSNGTKIDPNVDNVNNSSVEETKISRKVQSDPVIATASTSVNRDKNGDRFFSAKTPDGKELNYKILSEDDKSLCVIKGKYNYSEIVIPEYVLINDTKYCVTTINNNCFDGLEDIKEVRLPFTLVCIGDYAFRNLFRLNSIDFPNNLKTIGKGAFSGSWLESIILPDGLETIGSKAFSYVRYGFSQKDRFVVKEIYIPKTVKTIGRDCFIYCGKSLSPGKKCKALFSSLPFFVTESNSEEYGIDDSAVRDYKERSGKPE